mgnify:CR=1 FL=1
MNIYDMEASVSPLQKLTENNRKVQSFAAQHNDLEDELNQAQLKLFSIQRRILLESHKSQIFKIKSFKHIMFDPNLMQNEKMKLFVIWSGLQNSRRQLQKFVEDYRKR